MKQTKLSHPLLRGGHPALVPNLQSGKEAEEDDHEGAKAKEEGDGDGQLALEVHHHRKRGKDPTSSVPVRRLQAILSLPLQTEGKKNSTQSKICLFYRGCKGLCRKDFMTADFIFGSPLVIPFEGGFCLVVIPEIRSCSKVTGTAWITVQGTWRKYNCEGHQE